MTPVCVHRWNSRRATFLCVPWRKPVP